jgi:hypothetical protein
MHIQLGLWGEDMDDNKPLVIAGGLLHSHPSAWHTNALVWIC